MRSTRFPYIDFLFGVLCGFLLGSSLDKTLSAIAGKVIFGAAILVIAVFWRRAEATAHTRHVESWQSHRQRGKRRFVIVNYLFLRGGVLLVVLLGPLWGTLGFSTEDRGYLATVILMLAIITVYLGREEWDTCEQEHKALTLKHAAERERDATSLTN
jgi:hypothetical protein